MSSRPCRASCASCSSSCRPANCRAAAPAGSYIIRATTSRNSPITSACRVPGKPRGPLPARGSGRLHFCSIPVTCGRTGPVSGVRVRLSARADLRHLSCAEGDRPSGLSAASTALVSGSGSAASPERTASTDRSPARSAGAACPGAAEGYGQHARQASQPAGDVVSELLISHRHQHRIGRGPGHADKS
jgi:hypothetical protein